MQLKTHNLPFDQEKVGLYSCETPSKYIQHAQTMHLFFKVVFLHNMAIWQRCWVAFIIISYKLRVRRIFF